MTAAGGQSENGRSENMEAIAWQLLDQATDRDIKLRLTGSLAVRHHCHTWGSAMSDLGRRPPRDIDLAGYWSQRKAIASLFESQGFRLDPAIAQAQEYGIKRFVYEHPDDGVKVDVFMDELVMAHTISYRDRLELSAPTLPVTDLLLSKLQVHEMTANDLVDMTILFLEHETSDSPQPDVIDCLQVADILRNDWGFWYEAMQNLDRVEHALAGYPHFGDQDRSVAQCAIADLRTALVETPKSARWKLRARFGDRVRYWEEVDEVHRKEPDQI